MSNLARQESQSARRGVRPESAPAHRRRQLRVLFVYRDTEAINPCLEALDKGHFMVRFDLVFNLAECTKQLRSQRYDVVLVEDCGLNLEGSPEMRLLHHTAQEIPVIVLTTSGVCESIADLAVHGVFDCVEREHIAKLPMVVRRVLKEKKLSEELEEARKALQHSQGRYRALLDNPAYGIYRSDAEGRVLDANQALVTMLGYASKEELLAANQVSPIIPYRGDSLPIADRAAVADQIQAIEIAWKRKDGSTLKTRLSGRGVFDGQGTFVGHEIIAVDVTEQRALEDQLRRQATTDSLTGLANHRRLCEVLQAEISRSKRTEREFSLVLLDLDGLKEINDQFGHLAGNRALCRLAQILADCCRSVDTAARHGGDEFAVVLPETGMAAATLVAQRIRDLLAKDAEEPALSVSVGLASFPHEADSISSLLYAADRALYAMKSGKLPSARSNFPASTDSSPIVLRHRGPQELEVKMKMRT
jgi:diguanylate cyclase (GGDEF)-like protein/PAS domain S-box-containing protein